MLWVSLLIGSGVLTETFELFIMCLYISHSEFIFVLVLYGLVQKPFFQRKIFQ